MKGEFAVQLDFGNPTQIFLQDCGFDFQLMLVSGVLIMTTSAGLKVRAQRRDPIGGRPQDLIGTSSSESAFLLQECGLDLLPVQYEGHKNSLAPPVLIGW